MTWRSSPAAFATLPLSASVNVVPAVGREEQPARLLQEAVRAHRAAAVGVHLEVEVGVDAVRVARVAVEGDHLAGSDLRAVLEPLRIGDAGNALALIVVAVGEIVVEVDVEVLRAALAVQVEHAAGARGRRVELHRPGLGGEDERAARRHDVVPLVAALPTRVAEVVGPGRFAEDREDQPRHLRGRRRGRRPCAEQECDHGEEQASGCRPDGGHGNRVELEGRNPSRGIGEMLPERGKNSGLAVSSAGAKRHLRGCARSESAWRNPILRG